MNAELEQEIREEALDELEMYVESMDNANSFANMTGIPSMLSLLNDRSISIQTQAVWVLGTCLQSNTRFSEAFLNEHGLPPIVTRMQQTSDSGLASKIVYALSGLLRSSDAAIVDAMALNTFDTLVDLLSATNPSDLNLKRKLAFLFATLVFDKHSVNNLGHHLVEKKLLEALVQDLKLNDTDLQEKCINALHALFSSCPAAVSHITNTTLQSALLEWSSTAQFADNCEKTIAKQMLQMVGIGM